MPSSTVAFKGRQMKITPYRWDEYEMSIGGFPLDGKLSKDEIKYKKIKLKKSFFHMYFS